MGSAASTIAPNTAKKYKRAKHAKRQAAKAEAEALTEAMKNMLANYDKSKTGTLNAEEVKALCEAIMNEVTPGLGGVTDEDVSTVMAVGGDTAKPVLNAEELPAALAIVLTLKAQNFEVHALFEKYDIDKSGMLPKEQLVPMLTDLNGGNEPSEAEAELVLKQCDVSGTGAIDRAEVKAAIQYWYCLGVEEKMPESEEEAKAMGFSDEQIAEFNAEAAANKTEAPAAVAAAAEAPAAEVPAAETAPAAEAAAAAEETPAAEAAAAP